MQKVYLWTSGLLDGKNSSPLFPSSAYTPETFTVEIKGSKGMQHFLRVHRENYKGGQSHAQARFEWTNMNAHMEKALDW
jgi:hypothetical protein